MTNTEQFYTKPINNDPEAVCPFLGLRDDPDTRFMYATTGNYCHRIDPAEPVAPAYQGAVCLDNAEYLSCPIYTQAWKGKLPAEIRGEIASEPAHVSRFWPIAAWIVALVAVGLLLIFGWPKLSEVIAGRQSVPVSLQGEEAASTLIVTETPIGPATETMALALEAPTLTPESTATLMVTETPAAPTPGPDLMTPFGPDAFFLLHRVQENESLPMIAEAYNTIPDVLRAANGFGEEVNIRPGDVLVVPFGKKNTTGIDAYQALLIDTDTTLPDLAFRYSTTMETLRTWNNLGPDELIPTGRWLVVPLIGQERQYPTATPTPFDWTIYTYKGPFGPDNEFVLHQVQDGENLSSIINIYNTNKEVTSVLNGFEEFVVIQPGQMILLMPGKQDLENVQKLRLVYIANETALDEVADEYGLTSSILAEYNDLVGEIVPPNSWLVIP